MYYVTQGDTVWTAHHRADTARRSAIRLSAKWPQYTFNVHRIRRRWAIGDTPADRYYVDA